MALALCACKTTETDPEVATSSQVVERKVPVVVPCDAVVEPFVKDTSPRSSVEEKLDALILETMRLNKYVTGLQIAFVQCGGKIK
jgi:hypothetical protein